VAKTIDVPELGLRFELLRTAAETGGELTQADVVGRPRGLITQSHVHVGQTEVHEVIEGTLIVKMGGRRHVVKAGESITIPPDTPHRQLPGGEGPGRVRVTLRPSGRIEELLERFGELSRAKQFNRFGYPRPLAGAKLVADLGEAGHAARPSLRTQKRLANLLLRTRRPYEFVDEWDVDASPETVFDVLLRRPHLPAVVAPGVPRRRGRRRAGGRQRHPPALQGPAPVSPAHAHAHGAPRAPARDRGRDRRRPARARALDARAARERRHARALRLARARRPARCCACSRRCCARRCAGTTNWAIARAIEGLEPYARSRT